MNRLVSITIDGKCMSVKHGTRLSHILDIEKPCGGNGRCGKCTVFVNGCEELACKYIINASVDVVTKKSEEIVSETGIKETGQITADRCFVLDIGTTTLALATVSLKEKQIAKVITATNPQRIFGADVITRISYCQKNGIERLHTVLVDEINQMIQKMGVTANRMYVSGNTTMLHTFLGIDCASIGIAPYTPAFLGSIQQSACTLGLDGVSEVVCLPSVHSFVGADIVAGMNLLQMPEDGKYNLFLDLGTNAEIVLYAKHRGVATAAAAGPCFEGGNISCGMSATNGAIYAFALNNGNISYKTIADAAPKGICGTGLIDIVAELYKNGIIDESGYMDKDYSICDAVRLAPKDVRQYQLAKSAVYSAILSLMEIESIGFADISDLYISGGFSTKVNIVNAANSGLIPKELSSKVTVLGNSSLLGTVQYACEGKQPESFTNMIEYVDLFSTPFFSELFLKNIPFDAHEI